MLNEADHQAMAESQNPVVQKESPTQDRFARIKHDASVLKEFVGENKTRLAATTALILSQATGTLLETACGSQKIPEKSPTPILTPSPRGTDYADYGLTVTPTATKEDKTAGLMTVKEFGPKDIPADLSSQLKDTLKSSISKIIGIEAHDPKNPDTSVPFYFVKADKSYVMFKNDKNQYVVDEYSVFGIVNETRNETHVLYSTFAAKTFVDFGLGGQFKRGQNETPDDYTNRVVKILKDKGVSPEAAADIFKDTDSVTITNPYTGASVKYSKTEPGVLAKIMDYLSPPKAYADSIQKKAEATPTPVKAETNPLIADLILKDISIDELKKNAQIPRYNARELTEWTKKNPVPKELQDAFKKVNPDSFVYYVGKDNRGSEMNAVLTTKPDQFKDVPLRNIFEGGFGAYFGPGTQLPTYVLGEFIGIVPIPESNEFYFVLQNPANGRIMPLRANLKKNDGNNTGLGIFNLKTEYQEGFGGSKYRLAYQLADYGLKLSDFIKPGDTVMVSINVLKEGDENKILLVRGFTPSRFEGYDELKQVLDKLSPLPLF